MADGFTQSVKGLKEVDDALVKLGAVAGERVIRSTLFTASKPILDQTVSNISVIQRGSGALAKATRRVYLRGRGGTSLFGSSGSRFVVSIAPKAKDRVAVALANLFYKRKRPIRGVFWGHLVEWGFSHFRSGRHISGKTPFSRAASSRASEAIEAFRKLIGPRVERAAKRKQP
jgi:hypothetical protein